MNVYAKFCNFPLRINKALGIFRKRATTTRTRRTTTVVAITDAFQRPKMLHTLHLISHTTTLHVSARSTAKVTLIRLNFSLSQSEGWPHYIDYPSSFAAVDSFP